MERCAVSALPGALAPAEAARACDCDPSFYGRVYDRSRRRYVATRRFPTLAAARQAHRQLLERAAKGELSRDGPQRLRDACERFVESARSGRALNKHGRPYQRTAWEDLDECLKKHVMPRLGRRRLSDVRRADVQALVDDLSPRLSGSRVRSIVNAIRSLYRWAQERELVDEDPAAGIRLPAMNAVARDRIATPAEFAALLDALELEDALPYALAAYAMGRRAQIQHLRWREVDLRNGLVEWGAEREARKSAAAQRVVPAVKPLRVLLKRAWIRQGRPAGEALVCPPHYSTASVLHTGGLAARAKLAWEARGLLAIGLHECRHTAATWLDAAGVSPKVASVLMGHASPDHQPGAAPITLARYTHVMPDAIEQARVQLDAWLAEQLERVASHG